MYLRAPEGLGLGLAPYAGSSSSYIGEPKLTSAADCTLYEKGEVERSHCQEGPCGQGHLVADVIRHPRGLLIADFGVGWSGIKAATRKEKLLQDWMAEARANLYSIILRIYGYSDCVGDEKHNVALRYARAEQVYKLLDKALQSRVDFMGAAKPGEYVADNKTKEGRAKNRGVIIELFRLREEIIDITDTRCLLPSCPPPPPPPKRCIPPDCPPPPPKRCIPPDCPPPPPKRPEPPGTDPNWKPPRIPTPNLSPKEILDRLKEVIEYLKRNGGDQSLIKKLEGILFEAGKIATFAGAVFGLFVFINGQLAQVAAATGMVLPRILHRFETSGMKKALERILSEITDPKTTGPIEQEIRRTQPRGPTGKFEQKQPGDEPPGSQHQREVCRRVRQRYPFYAEEVRLKRYSTPAGPPGQAPRPGLVLSDPVSRVDCIGSRSRTGGLVLYEAKDSGPPNFTNPGLTSAQKIVYPSLVDRGGAVVARGRGSVIGQGGDFEVGTQLPKGTRVRIITPANMNDI
jgi:hypothetical protein